MKEKDMAESMIEIINDPKHPVSILINMKLPGQDGDGEDLDVILSRGIETLRNYKGVLTKNVMVSEIFGRGYIEPSN
ncbi:MAG: hypothetical protein AAB725_02385 [Patescibacteria group bacterium]